MAAAAHRATALAVVVALAGCSGRGTPGADAGADDDLESARADAQAALEVEWLAAGLAGSLQLGIPGAATPEQAAENAARPVPGVFRPGSCLTTTHGAAARTVVHVLAGCAGPWGLAGVAGKVTVSYAAATTDAGAPALALEVAGEDLQVARGRASMHGRAVLANVGAKRTLAWSGETRGTTSAGRAFARAVRGSVGWKVGGTCVEIDGVASGDLAGRPVESTLRNYRRCRAACAEAGAELTVSLPASGASATWVLLADCTLRRSP